MCRIKVKNFGPIREGMDDHAWIEINKVTIFIGSQGSGKSTLAKLISTFSWMEKVLSRGDYNEKYFIDYHRFKKQCCAYHRIDDFFKNDSYIAYEGDNYHFTYENDKLSIKNVSDLQNKSQGLAQVLYIPAERNFISNINNFKSFKNISPALATFIDDFQLVKDNIKGSIQLPINSSSIEYDRLNDILHVKGEDYKVRLSAASSGFQSITPLYLVSNYFADKTHNTSSNHLDMDLTDRSRFKEFVEAIWNNREMTEEQKQDAISVVAKQFNSSSFINIVEEPEQNLYPSSQREILYSLLKLNNKLDSNKLIITTHSPYIISYLTIATLANKVENDRIGELDAFFDYQSSVSGDKVKIYVCNDENGTIKLLPPHRGLPTSAHALNEMLGESNTTFSKILSLLKHEQLQN